jgi:hypothetical protein
VNTLYCIEAFQPNTGIWIRLEYPPFETALSAVLFGNSILGHVDLTWRWVAIKRDEPRTHSLALAA